MSVHTERQIKVLGHWVTIHSTAPKRRVSRAVRQERLATALVCLAVVGMVAWGFYGF